MIVPQNSSLGGRVRPCLWKNKKQKTPKTSMKKLGKTEFSEQLNVKELRPVEGLSFHLQW